MSENAFTGALPNPAVMLDGCVVPTVGLWQTAQPMALNRARPLLMEVEPPGVVAEAGGGASMRMKLANAVTSYSTAALVVSSGFVESSGYPFPDRFRQFAGNPLPNASSPGSGRSWGNSRLEMPISTLYAPPEKMCSDLFCAFHPNRVMVPSLPLRLNVPAMPKLLARLAACLFNRVDSSRFSIKPSPKSGKGMRKMRLLVAAA